MGPSTFTAEWELRASERIPADPQNIEKRIPKPQRNSGRTNRRGDGGVTTLAEKDWVVLEPNRLDCVWVPCW